MSNVNNSDNNKFNVEDFNIIKKEIKSFFEDKEFNKENWDKCYKTLALKYHSDKQNDKTDDEKNKAEELFKLLNSLNEYIGGKFDKNTNKKFTISVLDEAWKKISSGQNSQNYDLKERSLKQLEVFNEFFKEIKIGFLFFAYHKDDDRDLVAEFKLLEKIINDFKELNLGSLKDNFGIFLEKFKSLKEKFADLEKEEYQKSRKRYEYLSSLLTNSFLSEEKKKELEDLKKKLEEIENNFLNELQETQIHFYEFLFKMNPSEFLELKTKISELQKKQRERIFKQPLDSANLFSFNNINHFFQLNQNYSSQSNDNPSLQLLKKIEKLKENSQFGNLEDKINNSLNSYDLKEKNKINKEFDEVFYFWRKAFFDLKILDDFSSSKQDFLDKQILRFIFQIFEGLNKNKREKIIDFLFSERGLIDNDLINKFLKAENLFPIEIQLFKQLKSNPALSSLGINKESIYKKILLKFMIFSQREKLIEFEGSKLLLKLIRQNLIKNKEIKFIDSSQKDNLIKNLKELNKKHEISIFKKIKLKLNDSSEISDQASINSKKAKFLFFISYVYLILLVVTAFYFGHNIGLLIKFARKQIAIDLLKKNLKIFLILFICFVFAIFMINFIFYDKFQYEQKHDQIVSNSLRDYLVNEHNCGKKFAAEFFLASLENGEFYFEPEKINEFLKIFLTEEKIQEFHDCLKKISDENFLETIQDEKTAVMNFIQEFFEQNILLEKPKTKIVTNSHQGPILAITWPSEQQKVN